MPADPGPGPEPIPTHPTQRRPRPIEEIEWKDRALKAEAALDAAQKELAALTERCATHERNLQSVAAAHAQAQAEAQREKAMTDALAPLNPIDPDLCLTLLERELEGAPPDDARSLAISAAARLASERPYLFRAPARVAGAAMAGEPGEPRRTPIEDALEEARTSGNRTQLLKYLRLRRGA